MLTFHSPLPPLGITRVKAAEGETVATIVVVRQTDDSRIHVQVVGVGRRHRRTRPAIAVAADVAYVTVVHIYSPATDKSQNHIKKHSAEAKNGSIRNFPISVLDPFITGATNIVQLPLAFVRSGYIDIPVGKFDSGGHSIRQWSRSSSSSTNAYSLFSNPNSTDPNASGGRHAGRSLRCR